MDSTELVTAIERGDAEAVTRLVEAGADPDAVTDDGLPALCRAISAYDAAVAEALVEGGADPAGRLPDGTTPLMRAIDGGSPSVVGAVLGREPMRRLESADREQLLARARNWYERGAENELRSRTGASGPARQGQVMDDQFDHVMQLTLGGLTVRAGHGAILTNLEWAFRILTPVDELVARAVASGDREHVDWQSARWVLSERRSKQTWSAVTAYRHAPDPGSRHFVLDVLHNYLTFTSSWRNSYEKETADLLVSWADLGEEDPCVLSEVLHLLQETNHRESAAVGLRHIGHPDPRVRARVPDLLLTWNTPRPPLGTTALTALLTLAADEDWSVRAAAGWVLCAAHDGRPEVTDTIVGLLRDPVAEVRGCLAQALADCPHRGECVGCADCADCADRTGTVADALVSLLDEEDFFTRLNAAYGLLQRDDPRTAEAIGRVGPPPPGPGFEHDHRLSAFWRWQWDRKNPSAAE